MRQITIITPLRGVGGQPALDKSAAEHDRRVNERVKELCESWPQTETPRNTVWSALPVASEFYLITAITYGQNPQPKA